MARVKLEGNIIYADYNRIGRLDGTDVYDGSGRLVGKIRDDEIKDSHYHTVAKIRGDDIYDENGHRIASMSDVRKAIDGTGGISLAAIWILLVR